MNSPDKFKDLVESTKNHLSLEEIQLAIGEFSMASAGYFLAGAGLERNNFLSIMIGGITGNNALLTGYRHLSSARQKLKQDQVAEDEEQ